MKSPRPCGSKARVPPEPRGKDGAWAIPRFVLGPVLAGWLLVSVLIPAVGDETTAFRVGFSKSTFQDVNENDASAAIRIWSQTIASERQIAMESKPLVLRGADEIRSALTNKLVDCVNMTALDYCEVRDHVLMENLVVAVRAERFTEEYVLLVQREAGIERIADLRGRHLSLVSSQRTSMAKPWLDTLVVPECHSSADAHFGSIKEMPGLTKVVLSVFFGPTDACVVTRAGFETMLELNPTIGRKLKILATSPSLVTTLFAFRADYNSPVRAQVLKEIAELHTRPAGLQILNLFQCDRLEERPFSVLEGTIELWTASRRLGSAEAAGVASHFPAVKIVDGIE